MTPLQTTAEGITTTLVAFGMSPHGTPAAFRLQLLAKMDGLAQDFRELVADERAAIIATRARATTTREAALELGLSPAAVAKAVARVRTLEAL